MQESHFNGATRPQISTIFSNQLVPAGTPRLNNKIVRREFTIERPSNSYLKTEDGLGSLLAGAVAAAFGIPKHEITSRSRRRAPAAFARQAAIYLPHVGLGLSYTEAGRIFRRDRTTAAHACRIVEERRDDACLDACLDYLEAALRSRLDVPRK